MSSSENDDSNEVLAILIVKYLKKHRILLEKTQLPSAKNIKKAIIEKLRIEYKNKTQIDLCEKNILKKMANMKCRVKHKSDRNKTCNKKIVFKKWETELLNLMGSDYNPANPSWYKIPNHFLLGFNEESSSSTKERSLLSPSSERESAPPTSDTGKRKHFETDDQLANNIKSEIMNLYETNETKPLNYKELQRLVLLKQNKIISLELKEVEERALHKISV